MLGVNVFVVLVLKGCYGWKVLIDGRYYETRILFSIG